LRQEVGVEPGRDPDWLGLRAAAPREHRADDRVAVRTGRVVLDLLVRDLLHDVVEALDHVVDVLAADVYGGLRRIGGVVDEVLVVARPGHADAPIVPARLGRLARRRRENAAAVLRAAAVADLLAGLVPDHDRQVARQPARDVGRLYAHRRDPLLD